MLPLSYPPVTWCNYFPGQTEVFLYHRHVSTLSLLPFLPTCVGKLTETQRGFLKDRFCHYSVNLPFAFFLFWFLVFVFLFFFFLFSLSFLSQHHCFSTLLTMTPTKSLVKVQTAQMFSSSSDSDWLPFSLWPTSVFLTGQCVKRPAWRELLRHSCTCIPDIPCVYHLLAGASLDAAPTHRGEQTGCSLRRNEWMPPIHRRL